MRTISLGFSGIVTALSLATLSIPATAAIPPRPGVVNYVEGNANIDGRVITSKDVGTAALDRNQVLRTGLGKAEILLTPGVYLRLGGSSELRMVSPDLANTGIELTHGEALIEATDFVKESHLVILTRGATTTLDKKGLYNFNADLGLVSVYDGEATVHKGDQTVDLKKGKDVNVSANLKKSSFHREQMDDLYRWSAVRSGYASQASVDTAQSYAGNPDSFYGGGWYWNPYFDNYAFIPAYGYLYSPFGWGFYSPWFVPYGLYGGGFYGRGFYGGGVRVAPPRGVFRGGAPVTPLRSAPSAGFRSGGFGGGFHSMGGGFHGGGGGRR